MIGEIFHDSYGFLMIISIGENCFSYIAIPFNKVKIQIHLLSVAYLKKMSKIT